MELKFNVGDDVWAYSAYDFGASFLFQRGKIVGINVSDRGVVLYKVRLSTNGNSLDYSEQQLGYTEEDATRGAMAYIDRRIAILEEEKESLQAKLR